MNADASVPTIVCTRVADSKPRVPNCTIRHCTGCFAAVWMSPSSIKSAPGACALCMQCFGKIPDADIVVLPLTRFQIRELRAYHKAKHRT